MGRTVGEQHSSSHLSSGKSKFWKSLLCPVAQRKELGMRMLEPVSCVTAGRDGRACPVPLLSRRGDAGQFAFVLPGKETAGQGCSPWASRSPSDRDGTPVPLVLGRRVGGLSYCRAEITARLRSLCSLLLLALASLGNGNLAGRLWLAGNTIFVAVRLS